MIRDHQGVLVAKCAFGSAGCVVTGKQHLLIILYVVLYIIPCIFIFFSPSNMFLFFLSSFQGIISVVSTNRQYYCYLIRENILKIKK